MLDRLKHTLSRLRSFLSEKTERAYDDRDEASPNSYEESYAAGEAHAYGVAEEEVHDAEKANENRA